MKRSLAHVPAPQTSRISKYATIQDGSHTITVSLAVLDRVKCYMRAKNELWDVFIKLPPDSPEWAGFTDRRNAITDLYRDVIGTIEYRLYLQNDIHGVLNQLAGKQEVISE